MRFGRRLGFTQKEHDLGSLLGLKIQRRLHCTAGVQARASAFGKGRASSQSGGLIQASMPAQKLATIAGPLRLPAVQIRKGHARAKRCVPRIASEHRAGFCIDFRDDERRSCAAGRAEHPFDIGGNGEPPLTPLRIANLQPADFDGIVQRHVDQQFERYAACVVLETAVALTVPHAIRRTPLAHRRDSWPPQLAVFVVA